MEITLRRMPEEEKPLLVRLMELYEYEFSRYSQEDISELGCYGYSHIDDYWNEQDRFPYLLRVDGKIAGFALVCPHCHYRQEPEAHSVGEFFVMIKYRRRGVGAWAAARLFDLHPGMWEVCWWRNNLPAEAFWTAVIGAYTQGNYLLREEPGEIRRGAVFSSP